jgi:hypothetical protein
MTIEQPVSAAAMSATNAVYGARDVHATAGGSPVHFALAAIWVGAKELLAVAGSAATAAALRDFADSLETPEGTDTIVKPPPDGQERSEQLTEFAILHGGHPNIAFLELTAARSGRITYELAFGMLDKLAASIREYLLDRVKPIIGPDHDDVQEEVDAAFVAARRLVADWEVVGGPLSSLIIAVAMTLAQAVEARDGRARAIHVGDFMATLIRKMPTARC